MEVMIGTTVTLLMMAALAVGFKRLGDSITEGRSKLNLNEKLRSASTIIRRDIEGMTIRPNPLGNSQMVGYLKYYDGPMTDYSATLATMNTSQTVPSLMLPDSRYGDTDDVLMFTCRAGVEWFRGKVPRAILKAVQNNAAGRALDTDITLIDWATPVMISSEYAEIVYHLQPRVEIDDVGGLGDPFGSAVPVPTFNDANGNGIPDEFVLHRRVLLIRPDLNIAGQLFWVDPTAAGNPTYYEQILAQEANTELGNMLGMRFAHTNCDLSIRRIPNSGDANFDVVAANSLDDLQHPENRFGHFQYPVLNASTTMPILALTKSLPYAKFTVGCVGNDEVSPMEFGCRAGFLHPFLGLGGYVGPNIGVVNRIGQDILTTNVLAFDVRGFDPLVNLYVDPGVDGTQNFGAYSTDDVVLSPNDPSYGFAINNYWPMGSSVPVIAGKGAFVDLNWGAKAMQRAAYFNDPANPAWRTPSAAEINDSRWFTALSGFSLNNFLASGSTTFLFTTDLYKSGLIVHSQTPPPSAGSMPINISQFHVYQPSFDSWSPHYEVDGKAQKKVAGSFGNIWINRQRDFGSSNDDTSSIDVNNAIQRSFAQVDSGTDGLDNDLLNGADDVLEKETSPPFALNMPAIQIVLRIEDGGTRMVEQQSIVYDFVSQ